MTKVLPPSWFLTLLDDNGEVLNGGKIYTYAATTTTPKTTWTDATGNTANQNPITLDSAGYGSIWLTEAEGYKFIVKDASLNTLFTVDNIVSGDTSATTNNEYEVICAFVGTPGAGQWMSGEHLARAVTFPANLVGTKASLITNPASTYAIDVKLNGVSKGTISFDTAGVAILTTSGGAAIACVSGDRLDFYAPSPSTTAANFRITLVGDLA